MGASIDITERKRAEVELARQLGFIETLTGNLAEGVYALDQEYRLTFLNPAGQSMLGWTQEELSGRHMHDVVHFQRADGTKAPEEECPLVGAVRSCDTYRNYDDAFTHKDGSVFPMAYSSSPVVVGSEAVATVVAFRDITEQKALERQLSEDRFKALG